MKRFLPFVALLIGCTGKVAEAPPEPVATKPPVNSPIADPITGSAEKPPRIEPSQEVKPPSADRLYDLADQPTVNLTVNGQRVTAWVMDDASERQEGMMFLREGDVKTQQGMIFVFPDAAPRSFWMSNTLIPLDIVYIDPKGKVLNAVRGEPLKTDGLPSQGSAKYVLELKAGEAGKLGIRPGTIVEGVTKLTTKA